MSSDSNVFMFIHRVDNFKGEKQWIISTTFWHVATTHLSL